MISAAMREGITSSIFLRTSLGSIRNRSYLGRRSQGSPLFFESKRNIGVPHAGFPAYTTASCGGDDNKLSPCYLVNRWSGGTRKRELSGPQFPARISVEGTELFVFSAGDEDQTAGGDRSTTEVLRTGDRHALLRKFIEFTKGHAP